MMPMPLRRELQAPLDHQAERLVHLAYAVAFWLQSAMLLIDVLEILDELVGHAHRAGLVDLEQVHSLSCETCPTLM
jgi:hypothetical protein